MSDLCIILTLYGGHFGFWSGAPQDHFQTLYNFWRVLWDTAHNFFLLLQLVPANFIFSHHPNVYIARKLICKMLAL